MSKTSSLLCVFLLLPATLASRCDDNFGVKTLKKSGLQEATALTASSDGGAIIVGQTASSDDNLDIYVLKVNSVGDIKWSKSLGGDREDTAMTVLKTEDNAYVVFGYVYDGNTTVPINLFKISESGTVLWEKTHTLPSMHISSVAPTSDGGFILGGSFRDDTTDEAGFAMIRLDANGEEQWHNVVITEGERALIRAISETDDGGFVLGGTVYDFGAYDHQIAFYKTDEYGDILWSQEYGDEGVAEEIWSVAATDDGGFVAAGNRGIDYLGTPTPPQISKNALVIKFDRRGSIEWDNMYGGDPEDSAKKIRPTEDGGYIFAGMTRSYGFQNNDAWVVKLNADGTQSWHAHHPGDAKIAEGVDVEQLEDGTYISTGKILNLIRSWDIFVWHLDEDGSY